jgi:hypothetical protein
VKPSFRFLIPSFVRRGQGEVAASSCHGRPKVPLAITMRTNPGLYLPQSSPYKGEDARDFFLTDNLTEGRFDTRGPPQNPEEPNFSVSRFKHGYSLPPPFKGEDAGVFEIQALVVASQVSVPWGNRRVGLNGD